MKNIPDDAFLIDTYSELDKYAEAFASEKFNLLMIIGGAGLGKSQTIAKLTEDANGYCFRNRASAWGMYCQLFNYQDRLIVIDDVDGLYADKPSVGLLKNLCQSDEVKILSWDSKATQADDAPPNKFATTSKTCLIANKWHSRNADVQAIQDRGQVVFFEPSAREVHERIETQGWYKDKQIFSWIGKHLEMIHKPSMRDYIRASELKNAGMDWQKPLINKWKLKESEVIVLQIEEELVGASRNDKAKAFEERGGGCRRSYFNVLKRMQLN